VTAERYQTKAFATINVAIAACFGVEVSFFVMASNVLGHPNNNKLTALLRLNILYSHILNPTSNYFNTQSKKHQTLSKKRNSVKQLNKLKTQLKLRVTQQPKLPIKLAI
jgi:hypothetical protein